MPGREFEFDDFAVTEGKQRLDSPRLYKVLLHNDNFTTMEFVVQVLIGIFKKSEADALRIMLEVHNEGVGVAGVYPFEIAEMKATKTMDFAREFEYPLLCTIQES